MITDAFRDQRAALSFVISSPRVLVPAAVRWVERLGGGLNSPVLPFFMLALNLSPSQMGMLSTISVVSSLVPAPAYGYVQDRFGTFFPIIVASITCGLGCSFEGLATGFGMLTCARIFQGIGGYNLPSVINAHITAHAPPNRRALVLSAFTAQCLCLRICGQLLYLPWDMMLRQFDLGRMLRFRITLSMCSLFCWFGVVALLVAGRHLRERTVEPLEMAADELEPKVQDDRPAKATETRTSSTAAVAAGSKSVSSAEHATVSTTLLGVGPCLLVLLLVACYDSLLQTTWPLFINTHYGWSEQEFAPLLFTSTAASAIAVALYPRLHAACGDVGAVLLLACTLSICALLAYTLKTVELAPYNVALVLVANGCIAALVPAVNALASTMVSPDFLGRLFAAMNVTLSLGRSLAGLVGASLYELSVGLPAGGTEGISMLADTWWQAALGPLARGGALPVVLLAPLTVTVAIILYIMTTNLARVADELV